jgi:hypothetical protein
MREHPVIPALVSALKFRSVPAVLLAVGGAVAYMPRDGIDPEAIEAAAAHPFPSPRGATYGYRFPAPEDYPLEFMPWIRSREEFIAFYTRGEDPAVVRRYSEGPEEELIDYLGEVFLRRGMPPVPPPSARASTAATPGRSSTATPPA